MSIATAVLLGLVYLVAVVALTLRLTRAGDRVLHDLSVRCPDVWEELGAPTGVKAATADPARRWERFVRLGEHHDRCDRDTAASIDRFRRRSLVMLASMSVAGAAVLYCLWQVDAPEAVASGAPVTPACVAIDATCRDGLI